MLLLYDYLKRIYFKHVNSFFPLSEFVLTEDGTKQGGNANASGSTTMLSFKENQRIKVAKELLDTERKYCHTLKTIQDTFALPLKTSGILSMKDIK